MVRRVNPTPGPPSLRRSLSTGPAIAIGMGSMIGAGAFAVFAPATAAAGHGVALLVAVGVAFVVALCNATSTAQLAATYPSAGGVYVYGRERLGPTWGFLAGWSFVVGKTASCAAMCLVAAAYLVPDGGHWQRPVAAAAVTALVVINLCGVHRTAAATTVLLAISLSGLTVAVVAGLTSGAPQRAILPADLITGSDWPGLGYGVAQAAGLMFFAFAGYARIATLGEEVRDPRRTIPRAILGALVATAAIYAALAAVLVRTLGADGLAGSAVPIADLTALSGWGWAVPVVTAAAVAATLGALLALLAGIGRTSFAMARCGDLPAVLARVAPRTATPWVAEVVVGLVVIVLVVTTDLRGAIGFSSFGVLIYYTIANLAALTQPAPQRRFPRGLAWLGLLLCPVLVVTLPVESIIGGLVVVATGLGVRALVRTTAGRSRTAR